jgi:hypothetical protein
VKPETILKKAKAVSPTFYLYAEYMLDAFPTMNMPTLKDCFKHNTKLYPASAIAAARVQALEEAAKVCLDLELDDRYKTMISTDDWNAGTLDCDTAIRALIGKEST